jgi:putative acetyltransferase
MIKVREYQKTDAAELATIYFNTIHIINIHDYSEAQVNVWAPEKARDPQGWMLKWEKIPPLVAVINDQPVGFAEFESSGHIDCFYVHHEYQGQGIGSLLIQSIFNEAQKQNINRIFAEVSITARPFFESKGFKVLKQQTIILQGVKLSNFVMEKHF